MDSIVGGLKLTVSKLRRKSLYTSTLVILVWQ